MQKEVMSTLKQSSCKKMLMLPLQNRHTVGIQGGTEMAVMMYKLMAKFLTIKFFNYYQQSGQINIEN